MSKTFKTSVNNTFDFEIKDDDISNLDALQISESKFHVLEQNKSYHAKIIREDFNKKAYEVKINNNTYNISILNDLDTLIKDMGFAVGATKHIGSIKAPMPGLILEINVKANQEVKEDDPLLILEAMKMENIITSPTDGVIKSISVNKGDAVDKNQLLIEFNA
ncbi:acetyl-CoA carboxylase biotin carboxyl carrier protein subunit [Flavivirga rizhaonensis]|uniref:Acetyl-CoA carboxylase biotin carboxyl carrier protein subunit n=1 Tax=Flavivirga rizhaonensis TaxID=2559571 RepID=A0A4S1DRQ2_9FLAO|nr:acetyl-CoA carboxylase biotin carboxyl carrier protein subunit [Flavivirga rizhaonensis]TGV00395.1 acetyl-CoA carboxylase biotin carboxyl carrier protein subunit [Flavivirga rizhaonensis]